MQDMDMPSGISGNLMDGMDKIGNVSEDSLEGIVTPSETSGTSENITDGTDKTDASFSDTSNRIPTLSETCEATPDALQPFTQDAPTLLSWFATLNAPEIGSYFYPRLANFTISFIPSLDTAKLATAHTTLSDAEQLELVRAGIDAYFDVLAPDDDTDIRAAFAVLYRAFVAELDEAAGLDMVLGAVDALWEAEMLLHAGRVEEVRKNLRGLRERVVANSEVFVGNADVGIVVADAATLDEGGLDDRVRALLAGALAQAE
ncbi:uncharacterized protein K452DRAFT_302618 [Aplosporella prunicola CBS 121167]|uniref:Uncharacterized protein n=1 Tax=Aplosporella prunicola CBS 121167 TaxID=1176127 RepID=A0A6A6AYC2_9PEZI|nr:uncharacterized protein K452DRAFT_302618 [Aplosporella prunicola CBS 121167]KAF2136606.1 hypothetical protein K452DRAFT_302618 [Aplosporella prunicola CBS 121167]